MPVSVHDAGRLANLAGDQRRMLVGNPTHIHLDVQEIVRGKFGDYPPRNDIEITEAFNDARDGAGISVCDDLQPPPGIGSGRNPWNQCLLK